MLPGRRLRLLPTVVICFTLLSLLTWFNSPKHTYTQLPDPLQPTTTKKNPRILLVSAFFPLPHSKHTNEEYKTWLNHFLGTISTDIYFYTTPALAPLARTLHGNAHANKNEDKNRHTLTIDTTYTSPLSIPPLYPHRERYTQMHKWDRERARHSPALYAVWNAKPWFLEHALLNLTATGSEYEYGFWVDAGSFRTEHVYKFWPDPRRVEEAWEEAYSKSRKEGLKGKEDLVFFPVFELPGLSEIGWRRKKGPVDIDFSEGSFFGSTPSGIAWYTDLFYRYHDYYISTPPPSTPRHTHMPPFHFVGKDQTLINALMFLHPHRFFTVLSPSHTPLLPPNINTQINTEDDTTTMPPPPPPRPVVGTFSHTLRTGTTLLKAKLLTLFRGSPALGPCGDEWFYFQYWLAAPAERADMCDRVWSVRVGVRQWIVGWFTGKGCQLTELVTVEGVLRALFGRRWVERVREGGV